ncbi:LuxR family transcriptional regulator [Sporichthya polymorpha]|uniref:LuxR family transcriptional regulator n=1 Tax=Sporichthya polymorpha TaxID=35751 RepID=UPI0003680F44|nr:LuxR family transcriptional regulator [Sporichthya polymorpha]
MSHVEEATRSQELAWQAFRDADLHGARGHLEAAFRHWRAAREPRHAARIAATLADVHGTFLGNPAAGQGWVHRGRRQLEPVGRCVELGYLELAITACELTDIERLLTAADAALELAIEFGDPDLEVRALADSGYGLVLHGRLTEGFARLDEAMAALSTGELADVSLAATSYCAILTAYDRAGDAARAEELQRIVTALPPERRPRVLYAHCRLAYGSVLCTVGRWPEGETAMRDVLDEPGATPGQRHDAATRLAELRLLQGKFAEAAELLAAARSRPSAAEPLARLHLATGRPDLAVGLLRREVDAVPGDRMRTGALLGLLVEAAVVQQALDEARAAAARLTELTALTDDQILRAEAALAVGRVAVAEGDPAALTYFRAALEHLGGERPVRSAAVCLEVAQVLADAGDTAAAVVEAQDALAVFDRVGARLCSDRAAALLRTLGTPTRAAGRSPDAVLPHLTAREREVLELLRSGLTNAEIGARLFISAKTAEHHVGRLLAKLGVRSRAEAAAFAAAHLGRT